MIGKWLYFEFLTPINDYIETITIKEAFYDWLAPILLSISFFVYVRYSGIVIDVKELLSPTINFLAILIGFSVACISVLSTNDNNNLKQLKGKLTERKTGTKHISLYQLILITYIYSVLIEFMTLFINLGYLFFNLIGFFSSYQDLVASVNVLLLLHIILLNVRNVTNFYFVFWKDK